MSNSEHNLPALSVEAARAALAERLTQHRRERGWSTTELAQRAGLDSASTTWNVQAGTKRPRPATLAAIATALELPQSENAELLRLYLLGDPAYQGAAHAWVEKATAAAYLETIEQIQSLVASLTHCANVGFGAPPTTAQGALASDIAGYMVPWARLRRLFATEADLRTWHASLHPAERLPVGGEAAALDMALLPSGLTVAHALAAERGGRGRPPRRFDPQLWQQFLTRILGGASAGRAHREAAMEAAKSGRAWPDSPRVTRQRYAEFTRRIPDWQRYKGAS